MYKYTNYLLFLSFVLDSVHAKKPKPVIIVNIIPVLEPVKDITPYINRVNIITVKNCRDFFLITSTNNNKNTTYREIKY